MKIKEFSIRRYGPLPDRGRIFLSNFNLFYGKNESGKTLTIDALIKLLIERNIKSFKHINRIIEDPEGYVIIELEDKKEIKLSGKKNLINILNFTSAEFCNIFIIRDSNLSISNEGEFYTNITDRLLGLRTNDIINIKDNLKKIGKLTDTGTFKDVKGEKLKSRITSAEKYINLIDNLLEEIKINNFEILEEDYINTLEELDDIEHKLEDFENARKREKYEKGKEALDKLIEELDQLKLLETFNEDDKQKWRDNENKIKNNLERKEKQITELNKKETEKIEINKELKIKEIEFKTPDDIKKELDIIKNKELFEYEIKTGDLANQAEKVKYFNILLLISAILLGISLLGFLINPTIQASFFAIIFGFLSIGSIIYKYLYIKEKAWLAGLFERAKLKLSKFGLESESIKGCLTNIQKFEEEYNKKSEEIQNLLQVKGNLLVEINQLKETWIPLTDREIEKNESLINDLKEQSGIQSLQEYTNKLNLKQKYIASVRSLKIVLESHFGFVGKTEELYIINWEKEIKNLEEYKDKVKEILYDEKIVSDLQTRKDLVKMDLNEMESNLTKLQKEFEEIEREGNNILRTDSDFICCTTINDLYKIKERLIRFLEKNNNTRENILNIISIFEELESEEREKISELISKESSVSEYFNEITNGLYEEVIFEVESGRIKVRRKDNVKLEIENLSGGTYDQLYFSIRLALGQKLLADNIGFFILDDPFIKADSERLQNQIEMLKKISKFGWQIIYFTVKDEIKDYLNEDIENNNIKVFNLPSLLT